MDSKAMVLLLVILLPRHSLAEPTSNSEIYVSLTGKSKAQLLNSGQYVSQSAFGNQSIAHPSMGLAKSIPPEGKSVHMKRHLPLTSAVRTGKNAYSVAFYLFTPSNPSVGKFLSETDPDTFFSSSWGLNQPLKLIVHDYRGNCDGDNFARQLIGAYMSTKKVVNLLCMSWQKVGNNEGYFDSVDNVPIAGQKLANFINFLKRSGYIRTYSAVHIIGYGLGAHLAGVAGFHIRQKNELGDMIGRITGLDPAGPGYSTAPGENRLDAIDARFVDVIHTNMGAWRQGYLGTPRISGHADFFPNGGRSQPTCGSSIVGDIISTCSHFESVLLYSKSIRGDQMIGCKCNEWISFLRDECGDCKKGARMGEMASKAPAFGSFFLRT